MVAVMLTRGTPYWAVTMLALLALSPAFTLRIAGIKAWVAAAVSAVILGGLAAATAVYGVRESTIDPVYLPFVVAIIASYAYSWWRVRRSRLGA